MSTTFRRHFLCVVLIAIAAVCVPNVTAQEQSLGDIARQNREKKTDASSTSPPKVITNADVPKTADESSDPGDANKAPKAASGGSHAPRTAAKAMPNPRAQEQYRRQILAQKRVVEGLERRLEKLRASIPYVDASSTARGEVFTRRQAWEQEREFQLKQQLEEQGSKLEQLQEEARRAGMQGAVVDP